VVAGAVTGRVGITEGLARTIAREHLPPRLEAFANISALVESICGDGVPVGVIAESVAHASVFRKPAGCDLQMSPIPGARMWSGIASAPNDAGAAPGCCMPLIRTM
jgi:hypothetical protein